MPKLTMLVGPPGSGKSTMSGHILSNYKTGNNVTKQQAQTVYVNQDSQGKFQHMENFREAVRNGHDIIVDRMNFNKVQRAGYIEQAKNAGYYIVIHVLHQSYATCLQRAIDRKGHETIKDEENARQAINFFFKNYERVEDWEADEVYRHWPEGSKPLAIVCDLDGTLCDINDRRHHVRKPPGEKKDWVAFMKGIKDDKVNGWCADILESFRRDSTRIVLCSGRGETERQATTEWLLMHVVRYNDLFMRLAGDSRQDAIVKEIILDFEILTRYTPYFMIDDRQQVVDMWRKRGYVCLQCDKGDF